MNDENSTAEIKTSLPMTDNRPRQSLGVGGLITDTFAIFFRHFVVICFIGLVPMILGQVLPGLALGLAEQNPDPLGPGTILTSLFMGFLLLCIYTLTTAILVQLTYDEQLGQRIRVRQYIRPAFRALFPILVLSIAIFLILFASQLLLMLLSAATPYLLVMGLPLHLGFIFWICATLSVCAPVILFEKAGLRAFFRSMELTRNYRWPIVGTIVLTSIFILILYLVVGALIALFSMMTSPLIGALLFALLSTSGTSLLAIMVTLIYARLREIKEGIGLDQVAAVFD
ncbi:hypothetical protein [Roseibium sp.]|uniref:hypothetical protein n=1 Tax=Roseibium sp. TaxID=1936156 RepID=UPI003BB04E79